MQVTGTVRSVLPTQAGGYQGSNGYIYTFDMVVDSPQGTFNGEIGSKSQIYPLAAGQPITVVVTDTQHGPRLKKVNPQYAQGPPQPTQLTPEKQAIINQARGTAGQQIQDHLAGSRPGDGGSPPPAPSYNPPPQTPPPTPQDYEAKERKKVVGMCFTNLLAARLSHTPAVEVLQDTGEIQAIWQLSNMCIDGMGQTGGPDF